jgi:hypothetical protein
LDYSTRGERKRNQTNQEERRRKKEKQFFRNTDKWRNKINNNKKNLKGEKLSLLKGETWPANQNP